MFTWIIDFEFRSQPGKAPYPWCVVGKCVETGEVKRLWLGDNPTACPFLPPYRMVAHYALAELTCYEALGWPPPSAVVDTFAEARVVRGQRSLDDGWGLLSIARWLGVATMSSEQKDEMRALALGDEILPHQQAALINYCQADVEVLASIWEKLSPLVHLAEAELRGRFLKALALVENRGIPVDSDLVGRLISHGEEIEQAAWIEARRRYRGAITEAGAFSSSGWLAWCTANSIAWPRLPSGGPCLDQDTFKKMADRHPSVRPMAYARRMRGKARGFKFPLGPDGRFRCMLSPFGSDTGRNQPSTTHYIFGAPAWLRSVIMAPPNRVLAYLDYASQEFALAAALSGDAAMTEDYQSGDPYLAFARRAGAVPPTATKATHPTERATYKVAALAVQYGMREESLAIQNGTSRSEARRLIVQHQGAYPAFWKWREAVVDTVLCGGSISTTFGWTRRARRQDKSTSIANFPIQAAGAEVLRIAVIALEEARHRVVATIHDAVLVELDFDGWEEELLEVRRQMDWAARAVAGIEIRTDADVIMPGDHFIDARGSEIWDLVSPIIGRDPRDGTTLSKALSQQSNPEWHP